MRRILIVIDMQNDFIDGTLGTKEAQAIVPAVVRKIKSYRAADVYATRDTHPENYLETQEGKYLPVKHCIRGTEGWQLDKSIAAALRDKEYAAVEKTTFGSMDLPRLIEKAAEGEDFSVELIGLCTDICVVSNALLLKASFPEMSVSVDSECCAGVTPQLHEAALATMRSCQIEVK